MRLSPTGEHWVSWIKNTGEPQAFLLAARAMRAKARELGVDKIYFFVDPQDVRLILLYDRLGAVTENVVMSYEVGE